MRVYSKPDFFVNVFEANEAVTICDTVKEPTDSVTIDCVKTGSETIFTSTINTCAVKTTVSDSHIVYGVDCPNDDEHDGDYFLWYAPRVQGAQDNPSFSQCADWILKECKRLAGVSDSQQGGGGSVWHAGLIDWINMKLVRNWS